MFRSGISRIVAEVVIIAITAATVSLLLYSGVISPCTVSVEVVSLDNLGGGKFVVDGVEYNVARAYRLVLLIRSHCTRDISVQSIRFITTDPSVTICSGTSCDIVDPMSVRYAVPNTIPAFGTQKAVFLLLLNNDVYTTVIVTFVFGGGISASTEVKI